LSRDEMSVHRNNGALPCCTVLCRPDYSTVSAAFDIEVQSAKMLCTVKFFLGIGFPDPDDIAKMIKSYKRASQNALCTTCFPILTELQSSRTFKQTSWLLPELSRRFTLRGFRFQIFVVTPASAFFWWSRKNF